MADKEAWQPLGRDELAARVARDIPEGWSVNLGIGIPTLVGNYVPPEREVIIHSENGILGMGPAPAPDKINRWLINASSQYVTLRQGASYMSHSDSFALVRGGHLDLCVLGAFQVAETATSPIGRARTTRPPRRSAGRWISRPAPGASGWSWSTRPARASRASCAAAPTR